MRANITLENSIFKIGALLGCLGLAWIGLTAAAISAHLNKKVPDVPATTYFETIKLTFYAFYIYFDDEAFIYQILRGYIFHIFMWIYLVLDVLWVLASVFVFFYSIRHPPTRLLIWAVVTLVVAFVDFITVIILSFDYINCKLHIYDNFGTDEVTGQQLCANGILIPLTIAAKGFTLWFINFIMAIYFIKLYRATKKEHISQRFTSQRPDPVPNHNSNFW